MSKIICLGSVSPIVFSGPWGCGKTTHALRIKEHISGEYKETHKCIYWNASKSDFAEDPLPAFVAALYESVDDGERERFEKSGCELCADAMSKILFHVSSQLAYKISGVDAAKILEKIHVHEESDDPDSVRRLCFSKFLKFARDGKNRLNTAKDVIDAVRQEKRLIVIIDELDRCRPDFALKMLEYIKHLFDLPDCDFLLVMNKTSMSSSISHLYGLDESESARYLNKFFKQEFCLPSVVFAKNEQSCSFLYLTHLLSDDKEMNFALNPMLVDFMESVIRWNKLQLREVERIADTMKLFSRMRPHAFSEGRNHYTSLLLCFVAYLVALDHETSRMLNERSLDAESVLNRLGYSHLDATGKVDVHQHCFDYLKVILKMNLAGNHQERVRIGNAFLSKHEGAVYLWEHYDYFCDWLGYGSFLV